MEYQSEGERSYHTQKYAVAAHPISSTQGASNYALACFDKIAAVSQRHLRLSERTSPTSLNPILSSDRKKNGKSKKENVQGPQVETDNPSSSNTTSCEASRRHRHRPRACSSQKKQE